MSKIVSSYTTLAATFIIKQALNILRKRRRRELMDSLARAACPPPPIGYRKLDRRYSIETGHMATIHLF
ncbi:hypothetical protein, partial [Muribaculum sp.]|uniref:hypothetical protein n=1 Tax=Muribaculum sp. TaxID=1918611 RepID=UPI0023C0FE9E